MGLCEASLSWESLCESWRVRTERWLQRDSTVMLPYLHLSGNTKCLFSSFSFIRERQKSSLYSLVVSMVSNGF